MPVSKKILRIDSSLLRVSACDLHVWYMAVEGLRPPLWNNDMEIGSAFHAFVATMRRTKNEALALKAATDYYSRPMIVKKMKQYMTPQYLMRMCIEYWQTVAENDVFETVVVDGQPLCELRFSIPYYEDDEVAVEICGTIDDVCKHKHGTYAIRDYKTTSSRDKDDYLEGYKLSPQLMMYKFALQKYAKMYPDSMFAEINRLDVSCFIDGIFVNGKDVIEFKRGDMIPFSEQQMAEFERMLNKEVMRQVANLKLANKPDRQGMLNGACNSNFGCPYWYICAAPDDIAREHVKRNNFVSKMYDPKTHGE